MNSPRLEKQEDYLRRLREENSGARLCILRFVNEQSGPIELQIEPTGDIAPNLPPGDSFEVVACDQNEDEAAIHLQIDVRANGVSVWVAEGRVFYKGECIAY